MANYSNPFNTSVGRNKIVIDENYFGSKPGPKLKEFIFDDTIITEDINTNVDGNWGILQNLTPIAIGTDKNERTGRTITVTSISLRMTQLGSIVTGKQYRRP